MHVLTCPNLTYELINIVLSNAGISTTEIQMIEEIWTAELMGDGWYHIYISAHKLIHCIRVLYIIL